MCFNVWHIFVLYGMSNNLSFFFGGGGVFSSCPFVWGCDLLIPAAQSSQNGFKFVAPLFSLQLVQQEEQLRMEEEAYYEAKREAARIARLQKMKEQNARQMSSSVALRNGPKAWLGDDESDWEVYVICVVLLSWRFIDQLFVKYI